MMGMERTKTRTSGADSMLIETSCDNSTRAFSDFQTNITDHVPNLSRLSSSMNEREAGGLGDEKQIRFV